MKRDANWSGREARKNEVEASGDYARLFGGRQQNSSVGVTWSQSVKVSGWPVVRFPKKTEKENIRCFAASNAIWKIEVKPRSRNRFDLMRFVSIGAGRRPPKSSRERVVVPR
jgi:hypothetical protein